MSNQYIYADSQGQGNSYTLHLTTTLKNITEVDLVCANVPNVMCNITHGENVITFNSTSYSIPIGHYTAIELAATITSYTPILCEWYPFALGGRFVFSNVSSAFTCSFETDELVKRLGTSGGSSESPVGTLFESYIPQTSHIVYSTVSPDLTVSQFQFLDIVEFRNNSFVDSKNIEWVNGVQSYSGLTVARVFAGIPMNTQPLTIKTFSESQDFKHTVQFKQPIESLSRLTIQWVDVNGNVLNFGGLNQNSFILRVHTADRTVETVKSQDSRTQFMILGVILILIFLLVSF